MQPGLSSEALWGVGARANLHCGLALTEATRTGSRRLLISKLYRKGASETLRLLISSEIGDSSISFLISRTITGVVSSTPASVYLDVVPDYELNSEADVTTNFLALDSLCFSLNALRRNNLFQVRDYLCVKVCICIFHTCVYIYKYAHLLYVHVYICVYMLCMYYVFFLAT